VNNKNSDGAIKNAIGTGKVNIRDAIPSQNADTEVHINLSYKKGKKNVQQGMLTFFGKIVTGVVRDDEASPPAAAAAAAAATKDEKKDSKKNKKAMDNDSTAAAPAAAPVVDAPAAPSDKKVKAKKGDPVPALVDDAMAPVEGVVTPAATEPADVPNKQQTDDKGSAGTMQMLIEDIQIRDVLDTGGMFDGQDPAVVITVGKQVKETARYGHLTPLLCNAESIRGITFGWFRLVDKGINADFPEKFTFDISEADLDQEVSIVIYFLNFECWLIL
jgi:hypothetical protein